jgi:hypothetical protein
MHCTIVLLKPGIFVSCQGRFSMKFPAYTFYGFGGPGGCLQYSFSSLNGGLSNATSHTLYGFFNEVFMVEVSLIYGIQPVYNEKSHNYDDET